MGYEATGTPTILQIHEVPPIWVIPRQSSSEFPRCLRALRCSLDPQGAAVEGLFCGYRFTYIWTAGMRCLGGSYWSRLPPLLSCFIPCRGILSKVSHYWPLVRGIHRWQVDSINGGTVKRQTFPGNDVTIVMPNPRAVSMFAPSQRETSLQGNTVSHWLGANLESAHRFAPSQWETPLQSNAFSHWLGANLESASRFVPSQWETSLQSNAFLIGWAQT